MLRLSSWLLVLVSCVGQAMAAPSSLAPPAGGGSLTDVPSAPAVSTDIVDLDTLVVSGDQPGPGLWRVVSGGHTLWIVGTLEPLPRRLRWMSAEVEGLVARSQEVVLPPAYVLDAGVGRLRGLTMVPAMLRARRNPDGRTLAERVPQDEYARWLPLKARYLGRDRGVERWRPIFAAHALYEAAIEQSGLDDARVVEPVLRRAARRHQVPVTETVVRMDIEDPRGVLREFSQSDLDDGSCFSLTLDRIEQDLENMRARANAWALGDVGYLRRTGFESQYRACVQAITSHTLGQRLGLDALNERALQAWLQAAEAALARNASTVSALPVSLLWGGTGLLARLRERGYEIVEPDDAATAPRPSPDARDAEPEASADGGGSGTRQTAPR